MQRFPLGLVHDKCFWRSLLQERIEAVRQTGEVLNESPVDITQAQKRAKLLLLHRSYGFLEGFDVAHVDFKLARVDHVAEIFDLFLEEVAFLHLKRDSDIRQSHQYLVDVCDVFI